MSVFNDSIEKCLQMLYQGAGSFGNSASLTMRLAELLNFDTFLDEDAYTHVIGNPLQDENNQPVKFKRLSIAGSIVLLDIDILSDREILRISLSLANHQGEDKLDKYYSFSNNDGKDTINIDFTRNNESFLSKSANAEAILLSSLKNSKLGQFPKNLLYMANLDKCSGTGPDLFLYMDKIAALLKAIYQFEMTKDGWEAEKGYSSSIGAVHLNNEEDNLVGVFLNFWQDWRYANRKAAETQTNDLFGKNYYALLGVKPSTIQKDYLNDPVVRKWQLSGGAEVGIEIEGNDLQLSDSSSAWVLCLEFNEELFLPVQILQLFDVAFTEGGNADKDTILAALNNHDNFHFSMKTGEVSSTDACINSELPLRFVPVHGIETKSLKVIPKIFSLARTFLFLRNVLYLLDDGSSENSPTIGNGIQTGGISEEAKQKLIDTLQLPSDITDRELLGLSAVTDTNAYGHAQASENLDLESVMTEDIPESTSVKKGITITIEKLDIRNLQVDITITGSSGENGETINKKFSILNGLAFVSREASDMMIDDDALEKFIKALNVSEDIRQSLEFLIQKN